MSIRSKKVPIVVGVDTVLLDQRLDNKTDDNKRVVVLQGSPIIKTEVVLSPNLWY